MALMVKNQQKVKYLGSTATIRQATKQVKRVFDRNSFQFPPPAIDYSDSGFSKEEDSRRWQHNHSTIGSISLSKSRKNFSSQAQGSRSRL